MPQSISYPGVYVADAGALPRRIELPQTIALFVGYTHPFKTQAFDTPVPIADTADFARAFGGPFRADIPVDLPRAIDHFFRNGGGQAYVVGLEPRYRTASGLCPLQPAMATCPTLGGGIVFTAREPTDRPDTILTVTLANIRSAVAGGPLDRFDLRLAYLGRVETVRDLTLGETAVCDLVAVAADPAGWGSGFADAAERSLTLHAPPPADRTGIGDPADFVAALRPGGPVDAVPGISLLLAPGLTDPAAVAALVAAAGRGRALALLDPPATGAALPHAADAALFHPRLVAPDPLTGQAEAMPPSGFVAGLYARTDRERGIWKAAAGPGAAIAGASGVAPGPAIDGGNVLRTDQGATFPVIAQTLAPAGVDSFVPTRRLTLALEQALTDGLRWTVFEPNDARLWAAIRLAVTNLLSDLHAQGALSGQTAEEAYHVSCDAQTTDPADLAAGRITLVVAFAPLKPAEFVLLRLTLQAAPPG